MPDLPHGVAQAYALQPSGIVRIPSLINATFLALQSSGQRIIVQRLHGVFGARVNEDIAAVTEFLQAQNIEIPTLVPTTSGQLWVEIPGNTGKEIWRAQTYIEGITYHDRCSPAAIGSAGRLLAEFHSALHGFQHRFVHCRPLHDTSLRLDQLRRALASAKASDDREVRELGQAVLKHAEGVRLDFSQLPARIVHGDPKISNLLFRVDRPDDARCLIDLDTVGRGYLAYELGDALRSWTNPAGEDVLIARVELDLFQAAVAGYRQAKHPTVTGDEVASFVDGLETVSLELAARYATDGVEDCYFGWDSSQFSSRRDHNLVRARGQLALSVDVRRQRAELQRIATTCCG